MKPGRELDALVAEKMMGLEIANYTGETHEGIRVIRVNNPSKVVLAPKPYSTDIAAAWEVVEKMASVANEWTFEFRYTNVAVRVTDNNLNGISVLEVQDTAPHAICLAALKAVGVEIPD